MSWDLVMLLAGDPSGDPFAAAALEGATRLRHAGFDVDVRIGIVERLPDDAEAVFCHGIQFEGAVRAAHIATRIIIGDLPADPLPSGITAVDWCWAEAAALAGAVAPVIASRVGFVAGPPVPTQQRVLAAFTAAAAPRVAVTAIHLPTFSDGPAGATAGRALVEQFGCGVVAHSADAAGELAMDAARDAGAETFGFLSPREGDLAWISSDIAGVVDLLYRRAVSGQELPKVFAADVDSGFAGLEVTALASDRLRNAVAETVAQRRGRGAGAESDSVSRV